MEISRLAHPGATRVVRRVAVAATLAALAPSLLPALADAQQPRHARWWATFELTQTSSWRMPRTFGGSDCYHRRWMEGEGGERWQIKTRAPQRLTAYHLSKPNPVVIKYGTWDLAQATTNGLDAAGLVVRRMRRTRGSEPGRCGGSSVVDTPPPDDCGSRIPSYDVTFGFGRREAFAAVSQKDEESNPFVTCTLDTPGDFRLGPADVAAAGARFNADAILSGRRKVVIEGRHEIEFTIMHPEGQTRGEGEVTWTLTLTPAKAGPPRERGGRR